jgi:transcriptional regulator with XRE-family HTH domain
MNAYIAGPEYIGERLRLVRREKGLTQAELGELSGTNQAVIQKIENGNSLRPRQIMKIAQILEVNPAWLQFGDPWAIRERPEK